MNIQACMGWVQSRPVGPGPSSRTKNTKPMGDHSHKNNGTHRLPHIWPFIFTPYISPKPLFLPKIVTQSPIFFSHCPKFRKFFTQRPLIGWNLRKRYPNAPFFMAFVTESPPLFCLAYTCLFERGCCSLKHGQKLENFVFSKQNRAIWWILSGANLIKVMKIKFQFYRLNWPNCALYIDEFHWRARMIHRLLFP